MLAGGTFALADHLGRRPVVLNFWAPWCPQCRAEQPAISDAAREYGDQIEFFGIAWKASADESRAFQDEFDVPYDSGLDANEEVFRSYRVSYQPATVFINREGAIAGRHAGIINGEQLRSSIEELLATDR